MSLWREERPVLQPNLVSRVFHLPTPKRAREERPWFRLVTCFGDKFMFVGGVPVFQNVVAIVISDLVSLRATLEGSFSIEQRGFNISTTISLTIEPGSTDC